MSKSTKTVIPAKAGIQKTNGLVPRLRFPEFRDAGEWRAQRIGQHLKESRVKGNKGDIAKKLTVKLWGKGVYEKSEALQGSANTQYYRRRAGQFIYSKLDFLNQAFGIIPDHLDNYESTVDLPCFDASRELDVRFLLEYVQRKAFYKKYGEIADGGRKAKRIQVETFLDFPIFLPKLREQQKIADCLSSLDALIAAQAEKIDALKTQKKGLMQKLFPREGETFPRLRFPEFRDAGDWKEKPISDCCHLQAGKFVHAGDIRQESSAATYPCYGGNGLRGYTETFTHTGQYPLIGRQGAQCGNINFVNGKFHATEHAVVATANQRVDTVWLYYKLIRMDLNQHATGQAQPGLSVENLNKLTIRIPENEKEQQKIANCLSSLDALIAAHKEKLDALKTHKKGLMQQLFPIVEGVA